MFLRYISDPTLPRRIPADQQRKYHDDRPYAEVRWRQPGSPLYAVQHDTDEGDAYLFPRGHAQPNQIVHKKTQRPFCIDIFQKCQNADIIHVVPHFLLPDWSCAVLMTPQNILFVDDSPMVLSLLERTLTQEAFTLHTAHTPKEALQVLEQHPIDVVVSDLLMPGLDGITFLRMIKKDYPHIVRIILSGHLHTQSILSAINQVGVFRFLTKPLELDDDTLKKYCMRRLIKPNSIETACMQQTRT